MNHLLPLLYSCPSRFSNWSNYQMISLPHYPHSSWSFSPCSNTDNVCFFLQVPVPCFKSSNNLYNMCCMKLPLKTTKAENVPKILISLHLSGQHFSLLSLVFWCFAPSWGKVKADLKKIKWHSSSISTDFSLWNINICWDFHQQVENASSMVCIYYIHAQELMITFIKHSPILLLLFNTLLIFWSGSWKCKTKLTREDVSLSYLTNSCQPMTVFIKQLLCFFEVLSTDNPGINWYKRRYYVVISKLPNKETYLLHAKNNNHNNDGQQATIRSEIMLSDEEEIRNNVIWLDGILAGSKLVHNLSQMICTILIQCRTKYCHELCQLP